MWSTRPGGFSLVELLVTMAVIAVLATSVALVNVGRNLARGRDSKRLTDLELVRSALEQSRYDKGEYVIHTGNVSGLAELISDGYIGQLPADPSAGYNYYYSSAGASYVLCTRLEIVPAVTNCSSVGCGSANCNYQTINP